MPTIERSLRRFNVKLHRFILRRGLFRVVVLIGLCSFLVGIADYVFGDRRLGGAIIEWGVGCTFPLLLLMFIALWGTTALQLLAARRYTLSAIMAVIASCVGLFLYVTIRAVVPMLFAR